MKNNHTRGFLTALILAALPVCVQTPETEAAVSTIGDNHKIEVVYYQAYKSDDQDPDSGGKWRFRLTIPTGERSIFHSPIEQRR